MDGTIRMNKVPGEDNLADLLGVKSISTWRSFRYDDIKEDILWPQCDSRIQRHAELLDRLLGQLLRVEAFV